MSGHGKLPSEGPVDSPKSSHATRQFWAAAKLLALFFPLIIAGRAFANDEQLPDGGSGSGTARILRTARLTPGGVTSRTARSCARAAGPYGKQVTTAKRHSAVVA